MVFESLNEARRYGFELYQTLSDRFIVRRRTRGGSIFGSVPLPGRIVRRAWIPKA